MIWLTKKNVVIFTPPKCGSTSINEGMNSVPGAKVLSGPKPDHIDGREGRSWLHNVRIGEVGPEQKRSGWSEEILEAETYFVIRNPFRRLISMWGHMIRATRKVEKWNKYRAYSKYVAGLQQGHWIREHWVYGWDLTQWYSYADGEPKTIRLETFEEEFEEKIGYTGFELPKRNIRTRTPPDDEIMLAYDNVCRFVKRDFHKFRYWDDWSHDAAENTKDLGPVETEHQDDNTAPSL